jgi:hypothetical protein
MIRRIAEFVLIFSLLVWWCLSCWMESWVFPLLVLDCLWCFYLGGMGLRWVVRENAVRCYQMCYYDSLLY